MKRRTPLRTRKTLRRSPMRRRRGTTKYSRRERDYVFMGFVKSQTCMVRELPPSDVLTFCSGPIEADHMGVRGIGQKADDSTCVPMCTGHHRERHDHAGTFRPLNKAELREWRAEAIARTQAAWSTH